MEALWCPTLYADGKAEASYKDLLWSLQRLKGLPLERKAFSVVRFGKFFRHLVFSSSAFFVILYDSVPIGQKMPLLIALRHCHKSKL
jgi:hypothetical protein